MTDSLAYRNRKKVTRSVRLGRLERQLNDMQTAVGNFAISAAGEFGRTGLLLRGSFWVRLRWLLFGTLPQPRVQANSPEPSSSTIQKESV